MADKAQKYTVTNKAQGARGVGGVLVEAGETSVVELTEDEALLLGDLDGVDVAEGEKKKAEPKAEPKADAKK